MVGNNLPYVLGLLNSRLIAWYFGFVATKSGMGTTRWYKGTVEQVPLVRPGQTATYGTTGTNRATGTATSGKARKTAVVAEVSEVSDVPGSSASSSAGLSGAAAQIAALVDRVLEAKKADSAADTKKLEADIDALVYKLYGLTEDEIAVVEGRDKAGQQIASADSQAPAAPPRKRSRVVVAEEHTADDDEMSE